MQGQLQAPFCINAASGAAPLTPREGTAGPRGCPRCMHLRQGGSSTGVQGTQVPGEAPPSTGVPRLPNPEPCSRSDPDQAGARGAWRWSGGSGLGPCLAAAPQAYGAGMWAGFGGCQIAPGRVMPSRRHCGAGRGRCPPPRCSAPPSPTRLPGADWLMLGAGEGLGWGRIKAGGVGSSDKL